MRLVSIGQSKVWRGASTGRSEREDDRSLVAAMPIRGRQDDKLISAMIEGVTDHHVEASARSHDDEPIGKLFDGMRVRPCSQIFQKPTHASVIPPVTGFGAHVAATVTPAMV